MQCFKALLLCLCSVALAFANTSNYTPEEIADMEKEFAAASEILKELSQGNINTGRSATPHPLLTKVVVDKIKDAAAIYIVQEKIGHVVRLAFHDCVGGCDGCLNRYNQQNFGKWIGTVDKMDRFFDFFNLETHLSRADFYQLVAIVGIENGMRNAYPGTLPKTIPFKYGRVDCPTSPNTDDDRDFGSGHFDHSELYTYFQEEFGMSVVETTAIMGAHTVGELSGASGFIGFFKGSRSASYQWDNKFYGRLMNANLYWTQHEVSSQTNDERTRWQWKATPYDNPDVVKANYLNVDLSLLRDLQPYHSYSTGYSPCGYYYCPYTYDSYSEVYQFANSFDSWMADYIPAHLKMTSHPIGFENLMYPV